MDAVRQGYQTFVLQDAVRGVDFPKGSIEKAFRDMVEAGIIIIDSVYIAGD
jgi:nicotinamidase/pyrazinamidase